MKFMKSNFAKKLIIILVALMVFNIAVPKQVNAWDFGGIILKPFYMAVMSVVVVVDVALGLLMNGVPMAGNMVSAICEALTGDKAEALGNVHAGLQQIFVGPDTVFSGNIDILNANIFDMIADNTTKCTCGNYKTDWTCATHDGARDDCYKGLCPKHKLNWIQQGIQWLDDKFSNLELTAGERVVNRAGKAVARIYIILRNICALIMLAGLIFTGIRILLSSNIPTKKTQYLMLLQDWLIGMFLLIFSHIVMIIIFEISDALTSVLSIRLSGFGGMNFNLFTTCVKSFSSAEQVMCIIMLIYLMSLTFSFILAYFKRFFWVCILIVFAPVFSVMYAFGQQTKQFYAQWLKEYMLTVFVQPFHIVVYAILVAIPLGIGNGSGFTWNSNLFDTIYALIAMSFIRPAEKWLRGLFGMNKGIANMASYDSGKQTFDAAKAAMVDTAKKIGDVVKTAVTIGAVAATGGAAAPMLGAEGGAALGALGEAGGALGEAGGMLGEAGELFGEAGNMLGGEGNLAQGMLDAYNDENFGTSDWDSEYANQLAQDANPEGESLNPGWNSEEEYLDFMAHNEGFDSVDQLREAYGDDGINEMLEMGGFGQKEDIDDFDTEDALRVGEAINDKIGDERKR